MKAMIPHTSMPTVWAGGPNRKRGLRILPKRGAYFVHVTSRVCHQRFLIGEEEKRVFLDLVRRWADFSGISVITHCLMDNHFHLLLWVPERVEISSEEVLRRLKRVWPEEKVEYWKTFYERGGEKLAKEMLGEVTGRMYDLPAFMRVVKQGFSRWYNQRHDVKGSFWEGRYRSVVVEENPLSVLAVAAYIDLNPLRANLCEDPMTYRWCGYGEACGGGKLARAGLEVLVRLSKGYQPPPALHVRWHQLRQQMDWREIVPAMNEERRRRAIPKGWGDVQASYRVWLVYKGRSRKEDRHAKEKFRQRKGFDPVQVVEEFERQGEVPMAKMLRQRLRFFSDGAAIGGEGYLQALMEEFRSCFGPKRDRAARPVPGGCWPGMKAMREVKSRKR